MTFRVALADSECSPQTTESRDVSVGWIEAIEGFHNRSGTFTATI